MLLLQRDLTQPRLHGGHAHSSRREILKVSQYLLRQRGVGLLDCGEEFSGGEELLHLHVTIVRATVQNALYVPLHVSGFYWQEGQRARQDWLEQRETHADA